MADAKYVHTNLVARDWRQLARFYQDVLGCVPMLPERNLSGADYERGTGVQGARAQGIHLLLPGYGPSGPTLEIFQYAAPDLDGRRFHRRRGDPDEDLAGDGRDVVLRPRPGGKHRGTSIALIGRGC